MRAGYHPVAIASGGSGGGGGGGGGGGQRGQWHPPFRKKKNLHAYFLTINNPALAILLTVGRYTGATPGACDTSNNAHQKITSQPHPLAA